MCASCWNTIEPVSGDHSLFLETQEKLAEGGIAAVYAAYVFEKEGALQKLLHALKYDGTTAAGVELGRKVGEVLLRSGVQVDCIVPVPLHRRKERERGYNQAEYIARGIAEITGFPVRTDLLRRTRYTQTQTQLDRAQRKANMEEAFAIVKENGGNVAGKTILVVDDVITTGATIISCAATLLSANARCIMAASIALAR